MTISVPYGRTSLSAELPEERLCAVLKSSLEQYMPPMAETELVEEALRTPIGAPSLEELAAGKGKIVLGNTEKNRLWKLVLEKATFYRTPAEKLRVHIYPNLPK